MSLHVEVQQASSCEGLPGQADFEHWAQAAAKQVRASGELVIRLVDEAESAELNGRYRDKPYATNVLSFPADLPDEITEQALGDLVICAQVVRREAEEQHKPEQAHWAHMTVHGVLHLCGYDHIEEDQAQEMERLETGILDILGFADPYILHTQPAGDDE